MKMDVKNDDRCDQVTSNEHLFNRPMKHYRDIGKYVLVEDDNRRKAYHKKSEPMNGVSKINNINICKSVSIPQKTVNKCTTGSRFHSQIVSSETNQVFPPAVSLVRDDRVARQVRPQCCCRALCPLPCRTPVIPSSMTGHTAHRRTPHISPPQPSLLTMLYSLLLMVQFMASLPGEL